MQVSPILYDQKQSIFSSNKVSSLQKIFQEQLCTAEMLKCVENMDKQISFDQCKPKCTGLVVIGYEKSSNFELDKFKSFKDQYAAYKGETLIPQFYESRDSF